MRNARNKKWLGTFAASIGHRSITVGMLVLAALLNGCGGGDYPPAPAASTTPTEPVPPVALATSPDIVDGYDYSADAPIPLENVRVVILPPDKGGRCYNAAGIGYGVPADGTGGKKDYGGCTLAMVNSGVKNNGCGSRINGLATINDPDFKPFVRVLFSADGYAPDPTLTWNGQMKLNGHSTRCANQKSYAIELGKGLKPAQAQLVQPHHGLMSVVLKKHPYDLTRIRNSLSFYLFRSVPDMVSRPTWLLSATFIDSSGDADTQSYLNNANYGCVTTSSAGKSVTASCGLFENIEEDDNWLTAHGQDPNGQLWKAQNLTFEPASADLLPPNTPDSKPFQSVIEPQGEGYDAADLLNMLNAVNDGLPYLSVNDYTNDFETVFHQYFHPDNFRAWLAMNVLVNNTDTNSQNFYLYKPSSSTNFYFAPWDYDGAWDWYHQAGVTVPQPRWTEGVSNWWGMTLVRRYLMAPGEVDKLSDKINQLRATVLSDATIKDAISKALPMAQLNAIADTSPDSMFPDVKFPGGALKTAVRDAEISRLPGTVQTALEQYLVSLKRPMPVYQNVEVQSGVVTLGWDPSYSIAGNPLVYDVILAASPDLAGTNNPNCTTNDAPVPQLSKGIVLSQTGVPAEQDQVISVPSLAPGQYYLQVIARDATTGYCQIPFDLYSDAARNRYFGVYAFTYDGTGVTQD